MINVNMTDKAGVTLATAGKYCADNVKVTPSAEILRKDEQAKTATPTTSAQDITPDAGKALSKVTVNPITAAIVGDLDADSFAPAIVAAVEGKGVTVPSGTLLDGMAALIESIEAGGGNFSVETGSITFAESYIPKSTPLVISHSLGKTPLAFIAYNGTPAYLPKYQIAYLYKLGLYTASSNAMRSSYSTIMYSNTAGTQNIVASSASDTITLSSDVITISGTSSVADFNPDTSGSRTSTLVWFAIAEN